MFADGKPLYHQLADTLRERIEQGIYPVGSTLPLESAVGQEHGVGRMTVRRALAVLREEGLIITRRGVPSLVRPQTIRQLLVLQAGDRLISRMPTRPERAELGIEAGVPLLEVRHANGERDWLPADLAEIVMP
ncbi:MAG TPA: GntR family transcriptional regulator [Bacillota bacterium]|nr:GntR family transcriptional regulator [Bacillota bacterium]